MALDPAHLKPGALVGHVGRVSLVEDVLWIRYPFVALQTIPNRLGKVLEHLEDKMHKYRGKLSDQILVTLLHARLSYLNDTISLASDTSIGLNGPSRAKHGLIDVIGKVSRMLFGMAMDEDVEHLRKRYNHLTSIASANYRTIHINCRNIARLEKHVSDLGLYVNQLKSALNNALTSVDTMYDFMTISQLLLVLETVVNSLLYTNQLVVQNVVDAADGRESPTLFPVKDFLHALNIGKMEYELKPLFDLEGIHHYYPLLESIITSEAIVIYVLLESQEVFEVHQQEPFPFTVNGTIMSLNLPPSIVLISKDFKVYSAGHITDLQRCKTEYLHLYHCAASLFAFLPITGGDCEVVLSQTDASLPLH